MCGTGRERGLGGAPPESWSRSRASASAWAWGPRAPSAWRVPRLCLATSQPLRLLPPAFRLPGRASPARGALVVGLAHMDASTCVPRRPPGPVDEPGASRVSRRILCPWFTHWAALVASAMRRGLNAGDAVGSDSSLQWFANLHLNKESPFLNFGRHRFARRAACLFRKEPFAEPFAETCDEARMSLLLRIVFPVSDHRAPLS